MGYSVRKNSPREWRVKGKGSEAGNVEEQTQGSVLAFWLLLGIKHNWSLGLTGPFLEKLYAYQHLRIVCPWGEEGCICWMLYLISLVSGPPCSMLNPTEQVPRVSCFIWTGEDRATDKGSRAWVGGETFSSGTHAKLVSADTGKK